MSAKRYTVTCHWDQEAKVWFVAETDVPGLATEAATVEEMEGKLLRMVPELIALNEAPAISEPVPFELITRKYELAQCA
jgi:predicted RNase H-like HicB family nuclease